MKIVKFIRLDRVIKNRKILEWIDALLFAVIVATIFRTWLYAPFRIPTGSMIPTIQPGDFIFADMKAYGFVIPFTEKKIFEESINRGDIVIFPSPQNDNIDLIKRVVALENESISIHEDDIYINSVYLKESYKYIDKTGSPTGIYFDNFVVPAGKIFVMGDNRRNSNDSRYWGFVDMKDVRAKASFIWWAHDPQTSLFSGYDFQRIGKFFHDEKIYN